MNIIPPIRIALTTCDNIFDAGGVSASITRIVRGLSSHYNAQVDILMLNAKQHVEFNPRGRNGIIKLNQSFGDVSVYQLASWTGKSNTAQQWLDVHWTALAAA